MKFMRTLYAILLAAMVVYTAGCSEGEVGGQTGASTATTTSVTTTTNGDVKAVVSTGPSLTFNAQTAGDVDIEVNPLTRLPGIVYVDKSSALSAPPNGGTVPTLGGLKYAYMDTYGNWVIEVIDVNYGNTACGNFSATTYANCVGAPAATYSATKVVDLAYTSSGNPVIAYVYGTSLGGQPSGSPGSKQIRYAERSSTGTWTISVAASYPVSTLSTGASTLANVDPLRSPVVKIDPYDTLNRPNITYGIFTSGGNSGTVLKYLYRNASGTWQESDVASLVLGSNGSVNPGVAGLGWVQGDMEICPATSLAGGSLTFVGVAAAHTLEGATLATNTLTPLFYQFSVRTSVGTPENAYSFKPTYDCGTGTSCFTAATQPAGVSVSGSTNNLGWKSWLDIDSNNKPVIAFTANGAAGNAALPALYVTTAASACTTTQSRAANGWGALAGSGTGAASGSDGYYGFGLAVTPTMHFLGYTSTSGMMLAKIKAYADAFSAVNASTVDYTGTTALTDHNSRVAAVYDTAYTSIYMAYGRMPNSTAGTFGNDIVVLSAQTSDLGYGQGQWTMDIVDQTNSVASTNTPYMPFFSSAKSANGTVGVAMYYPDATAADQKLYYIVKGGTETAPTFAQNFVANFLEGTTQTSNVGMMPSLTYDANNQPVIAYYNGTIQGAYTQFSLNVARTSNNGVNFSITSVDDFPINTTGGIVGQWPSASSVTASSVNAIGVAYYDVTNTALKFARWTSQGGWRRFVVDGMAGATGTGCSTTADSGKYASLAFTSTGVPVIAYQKDGTNLYVAYGTGALSSTSYTWKCAVASSGGFARGEGIEMVLDSSNKPHIAHVEANTGAAGYRVYYTYSTSSVTAAVDGGLFSNLQVGTTGTLSAVVLRPTIKVNTSGTVYVAYYSLTNNALEISKKTSAAAAFSVDQEVDQFPIGGSNTAGGQYSNMILNSLGLPSVFYRGHENWLKFYSDQTP